MMTTKRPMMVAMLGGVGVGDGGGGGGGWVSGQVIERWFERGLAFWLGLVVEK